MNKIASLIQNTHTPYHGKIIINCPEPVIRSKHKITLVPSMIATFLKYFDSITDPRIERCKKHDLLDILLLAINAVLSRAEGWEDIEDFGHSIRLLHHLNLAA